MKWVAVLLCILGLVSNPASAAPNRILIANTPWHPYYGEDLPHYGMAAEIIAAAFMQSGFRVDFDTRPWARAILELKHGKYDAVATAYLTPERAKQYLFSDFYMTSEVSFYKRARDPIQWRRLEDLRPYRIGVVLKNAYSPEFDAAADLNKDSATSEIINIKRLAASRIDLLLMDNYVFDYLLQQLPHLAGKLVRLRPPLNRNKLYVMFSKRSAGVSEKIQAFNRGLNLIRSEGTLQRIIDRHLNRAEPAATTGENPVTEPPPRNAH